MKPNIEKTKMKNHISFSELKIWKECAFKHKLMYVDGIKKFIGNEHTAFGKAVHDTCEKSVLSSAPIDQKKYFQECFLREVQDLRTKGIDINKHMISEMRTQGDSLVDFILPALKNYFGEYEVLSAEEDLYELIDDTNLNYKGFIDLVLKTKDGKYHIIDWKTCSWGWDSRRRSDSMTTYQLTYYKYFFAKKHGIDLKDITTYFALLKRTAKKDRAEIFDVTSGNKKIENSLKLLNKAVYNIKHKNYIKNRLSCNQMFGCEFYRTKYCR